MFSLLMIVFQKKDLKVMEGRIKLCPIPEVILHVYRKILK